MAELTPRNCEWLNKSVIVSSMDALLSDTRSKSRANTYAQDGRESVASMRNGRPLLRPVSNHDIWRIDPGDRCIDKISALSTVDGRIEAYRGVDG